MYDLIIIGGGASGLHLVLELIKEPWFDDKKILLFEQAPKDINDKTYCYWEKGAGRWDAIISQQWQKAIVKQDNNELQLDTLPYRYKMLRSIDFYEYAKKQINKASNVHWQKEHVIEARANGLVQTESASYQANFIFDSRPPDLNRALLSKKHHTLLQHFTGWVIETNKKTFDRDSFTMMDFRVAQNRQTAFMYVLPYSEKKAMVEYTLFTQKILEKSDYEKELKVYIEHDLGLSEYRVTDTETGIIPMTDFPFHKDTSERLIKIGAAGAWVKPSSGYSFKNAEKKAKLIVGNLKKGRVPYRGLISEKHRLYDRLLLRILCQKNHTGPALFYQMYKNNELPTIFKFLDEETNFLEDLRIMASFDSRPFLKAIAALSLQRLKY